MGDKRRDSKRPRVAFDEEAQPWHEEQGRSACVSCANKSRRCDVSSPPWREDDKDGHYVYALGENLTPRYKIISKMGEGTFGQVLECWDRQSCEFVAIKVIRPGYTEAAHNEVDILREIALCGVRGCLQLRDWFNYRGRTCIVCERLGPSLYDFLKRNDYRPFNISDVREIGRQLLSSLEYLHELFIVHTDVKPENVLFVSGEYVKVPDIKSAHPERHMLRYPRTCQVKLIDFGSALFEEDNDWAIVTTRQYRAPEVILGVGWSFPCDIWSIGCVLVELFTGDPLFPTNENLEHLAMMERILGPIPKHIVYNVDPRADKYFTHRGQLRWPEGARSEESVLAVKRLPYLKELVRNFVPCSAHSLTNLLEGLLTYDQSKRPTAREALRHPFFSGAP